MLDSKSTRLSIMTSNEKKDMKPLRINIMPSKFKTSRKNLHFSDLMTSPADGAVPPESFNPDQKTAGTWKSNPGYNGLFDALHTAFAHELPIYLDAPMLWLTIVQAVGLRMNGEKDKTLFHKLLGLKTPSADRKVEITVIHDGLVKGEKADRATPKWAQVFPVFSHAIATQMESAWQKMCETSFSTSTPTTAIAQQIALMDSVKQYFDYRVQTRCGIPYVDLGGTREDWVLLVTQVQEMKTLFKELKDDYFHLWLHHLTTILHKFVEVYPKTDGSVKELDLDFWKGIHKYKSKSGGYTLSGWDRIFFPYNVNGQPFLNFTLLPTQEKTSEQLNLGLLMRYTGDDGTFAPKRYSASKSKDRRRPFHREERREDDGDDCVSGSYMKATRGMMRFSTGISTVPFIWEYLGTPIPMVFISGFSEPTLITDAESGLPLIKPQIDWMVTACEKVQTDAQIKAASGNRFG